MREATRSASAGGAVALLDWQELRAGREAWREAARRALEANVFHEPAFVEAALPAIGLHTALRGLSIGDGGGMVLFVERRRWGLPVHVGESLVHTYAPVGTPLLAGAGAADIFAAWLGRSPDAPSAFLFRHMPADGATRLTLEAALADAGARTMSLSPHRRPALDGSGATPPPGRTRKRQRRRLERQGEVTFHRAATQHALAAELEIFLDIEAAGWKGRAGTAVRTLPAIEAMMRALVAELGALGQCRIDTLWLDARPLAVSVSLGHGARWWGWKIAYDESFAAFSPGALLVAELGRRAGEAAPPERYDSCILPGGPDEQWLWPGRRGYDDLLVVPARNAAMAGAFYGMERLRRAAEARTRALVHGARRLSPARAKAGG